MKHQSLMIAGALMVSASISAPLAHATELPACDQSDVLLRVSNTLSMAERNVVQSGDPVDRIIDPAQSKLLENGPRHVAQRFCKATGFTKHGRKQSIYYLIEAKAGFAGYSYAVEACIPNRDPWKIHGAYCRSVR